MKINTISFLLISMLILFSCQSAEESTKNQDGSVITTDSDAETTTTKSDDKTASEESPFFEMTITGGVLNGKVFQCKLKYSAEDQATIEEGKNTTMEFTRVVDSTGLEVDFEYTWEGGLSTGEKIPTDEMAKVSIYNVGKDTQYDFERLVIDLKESTMTISKVEEWKEGADTDKVFFEGEGVVSQGVVTKFVSQFDKVSEENVALTFRFRARAVRY